MKSRPHLNRIFVFFRFVFNFVYWLVTHWALYATAETRGLGRSPSLGCMGGRSPPSQRIYNCFHFIKIRPIKEVRTYFECPRHLVTNWCNMLKCIVFYILYFFMILWDLVSFCRWIPDLSQMECWCFLWGERPVLRLLYTGALCKNGYFLRFQTYSWFCRM